MFPNKDQKKKRKKTVAIRNHRNKMRRFSFLDRLTGDKNKNQQQSDFTKQMAAIRGGQEHSVECNETFTDDNIADICLAIQQSESVTALRIKNVSIEPSIEFIASLCSTTKRLTELRLSNAGINEHESNCLIAALLNNKSLRLLAVDHNNITSAEQWAQILKINRTLESLDLSHNHLCTAKGSDGAMTQLGEAIIGNTKLRDLNLCGNGFQESSVRKFLKLVRENGDDVGLRSMDLVNDPTLPQTARDEVASVMGRPWIGGANKISGLKKPREAQDATSPTTAAPPFNSNKELISSSQHQQQRHQDATMTTHEDGDEEEDEEDEISVSNLSMTHIDPNHTLDDQNSTSGINNSNNTNHNVNNNNNNNASASAAATAASLRAAKIQKLQQMRSRHAAEIQRKEQTEKELREDLAQLRSLVERLKQDVASAQREAASAAACASAVPTSTTSGPSSTNGISNSNGDQIIDQLQKQFEEKDKQSQKQIQKLTSLLDEMAKRHTAEMDEQDRKIAQQQKLADAKCEQLAAVVATLTAENEQGDVQISTIKKEMEQEQKRNQDVLLRLRQQNEEKEQQIAARCDRDREEYVTNASRLQSQFDAANRRAECVAEANEKLQREADEQLISMKNQLLAALASAASPIAGFFDDGAHDDDDDDHHHDEVAGGGEGEGDGDGNDQGDEARPHQQQRRRQHQRLRALPNQASARVTIDAIVQTDPLPTFSSAKLNASGSPSTGPPVPSMDISSVTRFKLPDNTMPRPSSDDSFIGDSDDDDDDDHERGKHGTNFMTGGTGASKQKYLPKSQWIPDDKVHECRACKSKFGVFMRKHHCRMCGHVFCDNCAPKNKFDKQRVCHLCASCQHSSLFVACQ